MRFSSIPAPSTRSKPMTVNETVSSPSGLLGASSCRPGGPGYRTRRCSPLSANCYLGPGWSSRRGRRNQQSMGSGTSFAVDTLISWYRDGVDVDVRMPLLSTYLGHVDPTKGSQTVFA